MASAGPVVGTRAAAVVSPDRRAARRYARWARRAPLLPALIFLVVTTQLPFLVTLVVSLMDWNALYPENRGFAGFDNFVEVFQPRPCATPWSPRCC